MTRRTARGSWIALACVVLASGLINLAYAIRMPGEPDAARIFFDVMFWEQTGELVDVDYRTKVLPLFLLLTKAMLELTGSLADTIAVTTNIGAIAGAYILVPLFLIWRRFVPDRAALAATILIGVIPAFWLAHLYAFPTMIAAAFFATSFALFLASFDRSSPWRSKTMVSAVIFSALAGATKADIILASPAFLYPLLVRAGEKRPKLVDFMRSALFPFVMVVLPLTLHFALAPENPGASSADGLLGMTAQWERRFPLSWDAFTSASNRAINLHSIGIPFATLAALGLVMMSVRKDTKGYPLLVLLWALPAILFWGFRDGNSARHLFMSAIALAPCIAYALHVVARPFWLFCVAIIAMMFANLSWDKPSYDTVKPSSDLVASRALLANEIEERDNRIAAFLAREDVKAAVVGSHSLPAVRLAGIDSLTRSWYTEDFVLRMADPEEDGQQSPRDIVFHYEMHPSSDCSTLRALEANGYELVTFEYRFRGIIERCSQVERSEASHQG